MDVLDRQARDANVDREANVCTQFLQIMGEAGFAIGVYWEVRGEDEAPEMLQDIVEFDAVFGAALLPGLA